jgi:2-oxoglutarate ferredoxin oxidoreductase subunit gamma
MSDRFEARLAGTGGQGMILAGIILAEAAALGGGKQVAQTQSYGPEARGGASKAEVVISDAEIDYPKVIQAGVLLAMSQEACDRYGSAVDPDGWLIIDTDLVKRVPPHPNTIRVPITRIAEEEIGRAITANIVALGVLVGLTGIAPRQAIVDAVARRVPAGTKDVNLQALEAGLSISNRIKGQYD